jgi:hypothetical protein
MTNGLLQTQPPTPVHYLLGFNGFIDRIATMRLMSAVGAAMERGAQTIQSLYRQMVVLPIKHSTPMKYLKPRPFQ